MSVAIVCMVNNTALKLHDLKLNLSSGELVENKTQTSECGSYETNANKTTLVINSALKRLKSSCLLYNLF